MKDELISFDTAILAKEKGFKEASCQLVDIRSEKSSRDQGFLYNYLDDPNVVYQPTQSLLQRWLREVHKINIVIFTSREGDSYGYAPKVHGELMWKHCPTYEQALETALFQALKLINNEPDTN